MYSGPVFLAASYSRPPRTNDETPPRPSGRLSSCCCCSPLPVPGRCRRSLRRTPTPAPSTPTTSNGGRRACPRRGLGRLRARRHRGGGWPALRPGAPLRPGARPSARARPPLHGEFSPPGRLGGRRARSRRPRHPRSGRSVPAGRGRFARGRAHRRPRSRPGYRAGAGARRLPPSVERRDRDAGHAEPRHRCQTRVRGTGEYGLSSDGELLWFIREDSRGEGEGVFRMETRTGAVTPVFVRPGRYTELTLSADDRRAASCRHRGRARPPSGVSMW